MSLLATLAQEYRVNNTMIDKNEFLITNTGITQAYRQQTRGAGSFVTEDLENRAMLSAGRATKLSVLDFKSMTVRTSRPLTIPVFDNDSGFIALTWTTVAFGFPVYTGLNFNNEIDVQRDFDAKFTQMIAAFAKRLEELGAANLNNGKTLVIDGATSGSTVGGHTLTAGVVSETGSALKDTQIFSDLPPMMGQNDFYTVGLNVIGNQGLHSILRKQEGFGEQNHENKRIQYALNSFGFSNSISNAASKDATGYAVAPGQLGMLFRAEPDSILGTDLGQGTKWGMMRLPILDIPVGTYEYVEGVDISAKGAHASHLTRTGARWMDFAFDVCHLTAYNSDSATRASGIIKFDVEAA